MMHNIRTISPVNGEVYVEREFASSAEIADSLEASVYAQRNWAKLSLSERRTVIDRAVGLLADRKPELAEQITWQMGRPISQAGGEIDGFISRASYMLSVCEDALGDIVIQDDESFKRYISREPIGVVFMIAPWNYPFLTVVNGLIPALLSGNSVILKHSPQTPLVAEVLVEVFLDAGLPKEVFSYLHLSDESTLKLVKNTKIDGVSFTGSVENGVRVETAAAGRFIPVGLELGGKDAAYVRSDMDVSVAAENLVDGAFYNSGQSCCAVERIYVHKSIYGQFVEQYVEHVKNYRLGLASEKDVTLGPLVGSHAVDRVQAQIEAAVASGARALIGPADFDVSMLGPAYMPPQVLVDVDHTMSVMRDESFGPVVGIMAVGDDAEAVDLMNDSPFGLTASVWTQDANAAESIGKTLKVGTVFQNRCDYIDPALVWTGVKNSGRGRSLSTLGFDLFTQAKSFHLRIK